MLYDHTHAILSDCGTYRYVLTRRWAAGPTLAWVMLNPSTADAEVDDPTIRRVVRFTRDAGYSTAQVLNLYAYRATDPAALLDAADPVGPENDAALAALAAMGPVVCAWGAQARAERVAAVVHGPLHRADLRCLGATKAGHPRHPLYVPASQALIPWRAP